MNSEGSFNLKLAQEAERMLDGRAYDYERRADCPSEITG